MSDVVIHAENLGKKYTIGHQADKGGYVTLREVVMQNVRGFWQKTKDIVQGKPIIHGDTREEVWALREVSFQIRRGEAVGIIGRNGAGKSTLLKILSRITEPSAGKVTIKGRVASLLEVGTGFHPELTGRENIYLNGAILGMTRQEIKGKFDEIVAFAETEKYLDTPVKYYSSGMYVRLAFAVAAHLEPEILIVDEVLAVGDMAFQKKCLGKMGEIGREGRTVVFVSHSMPSILKLCERANLLVQGTLSASGPVSLVVTQYLHGDQAQEPVVNLKNLPRRATDRGRAKLVSVTMTEEANAGAWKLPFGTELAFAVHVRVIERLPMLELGFALSTATGFEIASALSSHVLPDIPLEAGLYCFQLAVHDLTVTPGRYRFGLGLRADRGFEDYLGEAFEIEVVPSESSVMKNVQSMHCALVPKVSYRLYMTDESTKPGRALLNEGSGSAEGYSPQD